jgi:hypothetical protein
MFELEPPTIVERIADAAFGSIGRAARTVGIAFWRWPLRRPLFLASGLLFAIAGIWAVIHAPFNWQDVESEHSLGRILISTGVLLTTVGVRKAEPPKN